MLGCAAQHRKRFLMSSMARSSDRWLLASFSFPASVAIIGATDRDGSVDRTVVANLRAGSYQGKVYAINPRLLLHCPGYRRCSDARLRGARFALIHPPPDLARTLRGPNTASQRSTCSNARNRQTCENVPASFLLPANSGDHARPPQKARAPAMSPKSGILDEVAL